MFALFDGDKFRAELHQFSTCPDQTGLGRKLSGFAVVQYQKIHPFEQVNERRLGGGDPEIHRVRDHKLRIFHLIKNVACKTGLIFPNKIIGVRL